MSENILIKFNTESTTNCPKFELKNGLRTIQHDEISLTILSQNSSDQTTNTDDSIIGDIISFYKMTGNPEFITQNMVIPFSFLLVDLNVHKPQYSAFIFIQPYEMTTFYIDNMESSIVTISANVKGDSSRILQPGKIFVFALDAKAIAYWKLDYVAIIGTPPPFYVSVTDFYTMLETDGMTQTDSDFLLNVLVQVGTAITNHPLYYNYRVTQLLQSGSRFQQDNYLKRHRILQYYLLIHPFERFNKREEIISKISA
jgi:hypothetical protein